MQLLKQVRRPRFLKWYQVGAILYGDWGSSKAYVLGIAYALTGHASWFFLGLMSILNGIVGYCYMIVCRVSPENGGAYAAVKSRSRRLGMLSALLLFSDYIVSAALCSYVAFHYLNVPHPLWWATGAIILWGALNYFGAFRIGTWVAGISTIASVAALFLFVKTLFHLPNIHLEFPQGSFSDAWTNFALLVLALSGVETVANMTGIMKEPVAKTSSRGMLPVLLEVSILTFLLGLAMNALPHPEGSIEDMMRSLGSFYVGPIYGKFIGFLFGLLLLYQVNMAISGMISMQFLLSSDREFPKAFRKLNRYGVPVPALIIAVIAPILILIFDRSLLGLASLYAVGVVGAIFLHLMSTATDSSLKLAAWERWLLALVSLFLLLIEITICIKKSSAFFYVTSILVAGLFMHLAAKREKEEAGWRHPEPDEESNVLTIEEAKEIAPLYKCSFLVALRSLNHHLLTEAVRRAKVLGEKAIYLEYVQAAPPALELPREMEPDRTSLELLKNAQAEIEKQGLTGIPLWQFGIDAGRQIARAAQELNVNTVLIGSSTRSGIMSLLRGDVLVTLARHLPKNCRLIITG